MDREDLPPGTLVARSKEHYHRVVAAAAAVQVAEEDLVAAIRAAVLAGDSWGAMGAALGTSRQNAYRQFAAKIGPVPPRRGRLPEPPPRPIPASIRGSSVVPLPMEIDDYDDLEDCEEEDWPPGGLGDFPRSGAVNPG